MKKEELYYDSRDGVTKLHAVRYIPEDSALVDGKPVGIVQVVHGMAEYVERYEEFADFFTAHGYVVTGNDHLGHGKSVPEGGTYGYFCARDPATVVVRDVHRLKKMTQACYPGVSYYLVGHSMGSFITRNYLFRYGTGIQGAVIMGTGMPSPAVLNTARLVTFLQKVFLGPKHVSRFIDKNSFAGYNKHFEPARTAADWLSKDEKRVDTYLADPLCGFCFTVNGFQTLFELLTRLGKRENLEKIPKELPVFMVSGDEDPVGDYGEGVKRAYQSMKDVGMTGLQMKLYPGDRHELVNELDREQVMQDILAWLQEH